MVARPGPPFCLRLVPVFTDSAVSKQSGNMDFSADEIGAVRLSLRVAFWALLAADMAAKRLGRRLSGD